MRKHRLLTVGLALALVSALPSWATDQPASLAPDKVQREKMAQAHAKMAECLRSARPMAECQTEMRSAHSLGMGAQKGPGMKQGCGMMDKAPKASAEPGQP